MRGNKFQFANEATIRLLFLSKRADNMCHGIHEFLRAGVGAVLSFVVSPLTGPFAPVVMTAGIGMICMSTANLQKINQLRIRQDNLSENTETSLKITYEIDMHNLLHYLSNYPTVRLKLLRSIMTAYKPMLNCVSNSGASRALITSISLALSHPTDEEKGSDAAVACSDYCLNLDNHGKRLFSDIVQCAYQTDWAKIKEECHCQSLSISNSPYSAFRVCSAKSMSGDNSHSIQENRPS